MNEWRKVKPKWIIGLNIRAETIKVSEKIPGLWIRLGLNFIRREEALLMSTIVQKSHYQPWIYSATDDIKNSEMTT